MSSNGAIKGKVVFFLPQKGYGFLLEDGQIDCPANHVFVHHSVLVMEGYRTLEAGQAVEFEVTEGLKGRLASRVWPL